MPKLKLLQKSDDKKKKAAAVAAVAAAVEAASHKYELKSSLSDDGTLRGSRMMEEKCRKSGDFPVNIDHTWNAGPEMTQAPLSRRSILSKSRECISELDFYDETEDVWFNKDQLLRDHLREVLDKWDTIDDEIWGKIICMERNRRVAKAYARVPVLTISGNNDGFDGYIIGLNGFENPKRDPEVEEVKKHIGHGIKLKMDEEGNIYVKRVCKSPVFVKGTNTMDDNCFPSDIVESHGQLEYDKPIKIYDMKKFSHNVFKELKGPYPDRRKLEFQCFINLGFVKDYPELLEIPCWIMVINLVALDMLKSRLPPAMMQRMQRHSVPDVSSRNSKLQSLPRESLDSAYPRLKHDLHPPSLPPRELPLCRDSPIVPIPDYIEDYNHQSTSRSSVIDSSLSMTSSEISDRLNDYRPSVDVYHDPYAIYRQRSYPSDVKTKQDMIRYGQTTGPIPHNHRHSRSYDSGLVNRSSKDDDWF